jgi:hypothetical protein
MSQNSTKPARSLVSKLTKACQAVGGIEKLGENEYAGYKWMRAADISKAFRHELFKRNILIVPDEKEVTEKEVPAAVAGVVLRQVTLKVEFSVLDGDSDQKIVGVGYGVALGTDDKMLYKAKTGALKYFLRNLGLVPDERDDVEFDESVDETTDQRLAESPEGMSKRKKRTKVAGYQVRAFDSAAHRSGKTAAQVADYLREKFQVASPADLTKGDFNDAIKWACGSEALVETLETSVAILEKKKANGVDASPVVEERAAV